MYPKGTYLSLLSKSEPLIKTSRQIVRQCLEKERNTLILSERINLIEECSKEVPGGKFGQFTGGNNKNRLDILS